MENKQGIHYSGNYTSFTREQVIEKVRETMSPKRFKHVLGVEKTALSLADKYGVEAEKISLAALLHDIAKERPDGEMRDIVISENLDLELLEYGSQIWHGPVGSELAKREYDISDEEILDAITQHTVGAPIMSLVAQVLYVADYIEPSRNFDGVEEARKIADKSLTEAVKFETIETIKHLIKQENKIYPKAIDTYNAWIVK